MAPGDECPTSDATSTITACTNSGNIVGPEAKCGVIAGMQISYAQGDSPSLFENMKMIISNCTNTGTLNGESVEILSPGVIGLRG